MNHVIHESAVIGKNVSIGKNVIIGPNCTIGFPGYQNNSKSFNEQTIIGDNTIISGNSVICRGTIVGENCRFDYHSHVGENCRINKNCVIEYAARVYNNIIIGKNNSISGFICNDCIIGDGNIIQGILIHKFKDINIQDSVELPPQVGNDCFIGRNAMVIGNILVKDECFIAGGAIITSATSKGKLYKGIPAIESGNAPKAYIEGNENYNEINFKAVYESISRYSSL